MASRCRLLAVLGLVSVVLLGVAAPAQAQNNPYTWNAANGAWSLPTNWLDGLNNPAVPPSGDATALVFNSSDAAGYTTTNDLGSFTLNSITINNTGTGLITIGGNPITLAGTSPTIDISVGSARVFNDLTGSVGLTKAGAGRLVLSGASNYAGGTTVATGTLVYAGNTATSTTTAGFPTGTVITSPVGTGTVTLGSGATFTIDITRRTMTNDLVFAGTAANTSIVHVPAVAEFTLTGNTAGGTSAVVNKTGAGLWRLTGESTLTGTLNVNAGTVLLTDITNGGGTGGELAAAAIVVNAGGKFQFGSANDLYPAESLDLAAAAVVTVNAGGVADFIVPCSFGGIVLRGGFIDVWRNQTLNQTSVLESGTIGHTNFLLWSLAGQGAIRKTTSQTVTVNSVNLEPAGGLLIDEGVIDTTGLVRPGGGLTLGTATTTGTLQYRLGITSVINAGLVVREGGGVIDLIEPIEGVWLGSLAGSGPLTKTGLGTLFVAASMNQTGTITVSAGGLKVNPITSAGGLLISGGARLEVNTGIGGSLSVPTLGLGPGDATVQFQVNLLSVPDFPLLVVRNPSEFTIASGAHILRLTSVHEALPVGTSTLIDYDGPPITSGFTLQLPGRTAGVLVYDVINTRIDLNVTSSSDPVRWTGAIDGTWDIGDVPGGSGTHNWRMATFGTPTNFVNGDKVIFDDAAERFTVTIPVGVAPARPTAVTVDTAGTYTIQGPGNIDGATGLTKRGPGTLVLANANTYTGGTMVSGGTLLVNGQTGASSGTGTGAVTVNVGGTLGGTGRVGGAITVEAGGAIRGGAPGGTGTLTVANQITINSTSASNGILRFEASRTGFGTANSSLIVISVSDRGLHLSPGEGNKFAIDLVNGANALRQGETYSITLATVAGVGNIRLNGEHIAPNVPIDPSNYILQSSAFAGFSNVELRVNSAATALVLTFQPVPEPVTVLGLAAIGLALAATVRSRRQLRPGNRAEAGLL